jgi:hypothetical protein
MNLQKERYINKEIIKDIFQSKKNLFAGMALMRGQESHCDVDPLVRWHFDPGGNGIFS